MEDNSKGLKNRTPFQENQRVSTLSPIVESWAGPQYGYGAFDGRVPEDPAGFVTGGEVDDETFRQWPEKRK